MCELGNSLGNYLTIIAENKAHKLIEIAHLNFLSGNLFLSVNYLVCPKSFKIISITENSWFLRIKTFPDAKIFPDAQKAKTLQIQRYQRSDIVLNHSTLN